MAVVPEDEMVAALVEWAEFICEHGSEAALDRARITRAAARRAAEEDRRRNLSQLGDDANHSEAVVAEIRRKSASSTV